MKKNKILYTLSALMMSCLISFSGISGSCIQVYATSVGIEPGVWNDDVSAWENIERYIDVFCSSMGLFFNPVGTALSQQDFYNFMISDGISHDVAHGVFCDCDDSTHTSFSGNEHGGGGHVREGINRDENGNVTISDDVSDLFYKYISNYLMDSSDYYMMPTLTVEELPSWFFSNNLYHRFTLDIYKTYPDLDFLRSWANDIDFWANTDECIFYLSNYNSSTGNYRLNAMNYSWVTLKYGRIDVDLSSDKTSVVVKSKVDSYSYGDYFVVSESYLKGTVDLSSGSSVGVGNGLFFTTKDGRHIKVYKSLTAAKNSTIGKAPYYATNNWYDYDISADNSTTISADEYYYYTDESTNLYLDIQNNIDNSIANEDNSVTITETYIQNIVNNTYTEINNNIPEYVPDNDGTGDDIGDDSGNTGDDSGVSGNNPDGSGGSGVGDFLSGLTAILDTLLSLVGKVMSIVADFSQSILNLFSGLTTFTDGFSDFLAGAFGFIPAEVWDIIKVGLSLAVLAGIIKFFRN